MTRYPSPALSYQTCPVSKSGCNSPSLMGVKSTGRFDRYSQDRPRTQPITPPAANTGGIGVAAISCAYRQNRQSVLIAGRAGGNACFSPVHRPRPVMSRGPVPIAPPCCWDALPARAVGPFSLTPCRAWQGGRRTVSDSLTLTPGESGQRPLLPCAAGLLSRKSRRGSKQTPKLREGGHAA